MTNRTRLFSTLGALVFGLSLTASDARRGQQPRCTPIASPSAGRSGSPG